MKDTADETTARRLRRFLFQASWAAVFLILFEVSARWVGRALPDARPAGGSFWYDVLEFTKDPELLPDPYLGFAGTPPLFYKRSSNGADYYETSPNKYKSGAYRKESFSYKKDPGGVRIFCIGGSSVNSAGMPADGTFPNLLKIGLRSIVGSAPVEVVNAGGGGTGSYQYREIAREVREYEPDLIVIYPEAGERKYLPPQPEGELADRDAQSPLRADARRLFTNSRLYIGMRDLFESMRPARAKAAANVTFSFTAIDAARRPFSNETFTRVFDFKKDRVPPAMAPPLEYDKITKNHERFVDNLTKIVEEAKAMGVPVLFVDTVRNLKHDFYLRFHVEPRDVDPSRAVAWRQHYNTGVELKKAGRYEQAFNELLEARKCYRFDRDEILNLYIAQCLEALGRFEKAKEEYERSYLKHPLKIRLAEVAKKTGAPVLDPYPAVCKQSPHGIPDSTMFMDSFHPMPKTNGVIAAEILQFILERKMIPNLPPAGPAIIAGAKQQIENAAANIDIFPDRKIQIAIYQKEFARALELLKDLGPDQKNFLTLMYIGYAQAKLNDTAGARQTYLQLKQQVLGPRENSAVPVPPLENDADVVRLLFDNDLFSEF